MDIPTQFQQLYKCNIQPTGEIIYKTPHFRPNNIPLSEGEKWLYENEREIAIKMPESEYVRFMQNWNQYIDIMHACMAHPQVREQYQTLAILVSMLK